MNVPLLVVAAPNCPIWPAPRTVCEAPLMKLVPSALRIWFAGPFDITSVPVPFNVTAPAARGLERRGGRGAGQSDGSVVGIGAHACEGQGPAILHRDVAA